MKEENVSTAILPLKNIEILVSALYYVQDSPEHLPKMITFSGPSGYGKSRAAAFAMNNFDCAYLEIGASWTISHLLDEILRELGIATKEKTIAKKMQVVIDALIDFQKPLIIDEFDFMVSKTQGLEIIREIHDKTGIPMILIGEELLPKKLEKTERFHNRILKWVSAEGASLEDARKLAEHHLPNLKIADDLLAKIIKLSQGRIRRICGNLVEIKDQAILKGWTEVDLKTWGNRPFITGNAPAPRRVN